MPENYKTIKSNIGSHFVLSTLPTKLNENSPDFEENIQNYYFNDYRKNLFPNEEINDKHLFTPIKFYMLGEYDILYITLINTFNFVHRLFEPIVKKEHEVFNTHTFQSYSGFLLHKEENLNKIKNLFESKNQEIPLSYFVGVINLKLNNGLYIGNGLKFIESIYHYIDKELKKLEIEFLFNQTFSWFEISLVIFINNPNQLSEVLGILRNSTLEKLTEKLKDELNEKKTELTELTELLNLIEDISNNCLYKDYYEKDKIKKTSLFSDTSSHFGFNDILIKKSYEKFVEDKNEKIVNGNYSEYVNDFINEAEKITLDTEIEWQVKPGHIKELINYLKYSGKPFCEYFNGENTETNMVLGKCDYLITENKKSILSNFHIVRHLHESRFQNCEIFIYVRKIRTYIFLNTENNSTNTEINNNTEREAIKYNIDEQRISELIDWSRIINPLAVKPYEFYDFENILKKIKVSRQIRNKILKIFSNFNNGVLDPIQFIYFIDFSKFIKRLKEFLIDQEKLFDNKQIVRIYDLERDLVQYIETFEEAYNVRFLNGYQFENIPDIDLDFNNSIQQLLSAYGLIIHDFGNIFFSKDQNFGPVVQLNNLDTVSNFLSINYAAHLLTSPEFIATTLSKEILNIVTIAADNEDINYLRNNSDKVIIDLIEEIDEQYFDDLFNSQLIDFNYFLIDCIRFIITFKGDFELFEYWFWSYNFQNTSLYDTSGMMNEDYLRQELFRILLVQKFFRSNVEYFCIELEERININDIEAFKKNLTCPTPEIHTYWMAHFTKLNFIAEEIFNIERNKTPYIKNLNKIILNLSLEYFNSKKSVRTNSILFNTIEYLKDINKINKPILLKRNWNDGKVIEKYFKQNEDTISLVDQTGGSYQQYNKNRQIYFDLTSETLLSIIDYGAIEKKNFIKELKV